jgi:hypothetical protein
MNKVKSAKALWHPDWIKALAKLNLVLTKKNQNHIKSSGNIICTINVIALPTLKNRWPTQKPDAYICTSKGQHVASPM